MFEKGEYVVYGSKGVCRIQESIQHVKIFPVSIRKRLYLYHASGAEQRSRQSYLPTDSTQGSDPYG